MRSHSQTEMSRAEAVVARTNKTLSIVADAVLKETRLRPFEPKPSTIFRSSFAELNSALGVGGFPSGRVCELFGSEAVGKTTIALDLIANAQRMGSIVAYIDAEHKLDSAYAKNLGIDPDALLVFRPETAQHCHALTEVLLRTGHVHLLILDSVSALIPEAEYQQHSHVQDPDYGGLMARWARKTAVLAARSDTCVVVTNQVRQKVATLFGNPETTTGGRALRHHCSLRIELRRVRTVIQNDTALGIRVRATVVKSSISRPLQACEFDLIDPPYTAVGARLRPTALEVKAPSDLSDLAALDGLAPV